jgi:hypothetical protein
MPHFICTTCGMQHAEGHLGLGLIERLVKEKG